MTARLGTPKLVLLGGAALAVAVVALAQAPEADPLLRAMRDEVQRSAKITVSGLPAPYFIQYLVQQEDNFVVSASMGGVVERRRQKFRSPEIDVRVGSYQFDNSNFAGGFGGGLGESLPVDNDYQVLRRYFWLETDGAYKAAVETLSRKRAALRNVTQNEQIDDFAHAEPVHLERDFQKLNIDEDAWTNRVRTLSAIFNQFPTINFSAVDLDATAGGFYLVNTEGATVREPETVAYLRARATAQAPDGMNLADGVEFYSLGISGMPSDADMTAGITAMAQNIVALQKAPKGEDYSGPVLFEGEAAPQLLAELLGRNLPLSHRPVGGGAGRGAIGGAGQTSELEGRIGARVMPDSFTVVDDPTQKEWHGRPLFGSYDVDREGVAPQPLHLIDKGVLKGYLLTREPVKGYNGSNGRARLPSGPGSSGAAISNLFISSSDTTPAADLKKKLIELAQERSKPYAMLVRRMDFPAVGAPAPAPPSGGRPISAPIQIYKVYPDGREEQVRGLRFRGVDVRSLKDILAAGDDNQVFEFMNSARGFSAETSVVAPSILIDDLELYAPEDELPKLPIVPAPDISK
ncbi:MAG TPA: metallopeptidase TldD-related protein [Bryobacteraceae bacterium]|nr:metallopeptidase TldD-related protein [Bryobacteraceae bacterium]